MSDDIRNVFVMGLNDFHRAELQTIRSAERYRFHALFEEHEILHRDDYPIEEMLERAERIIADFPDAVHGIIGHWDFPVTSMLPILCERFHLPGPSLVSVCRCTHKYWSRVEQQRALPECTPRFQVVDPFASDASDSIELPYPFWIKPVKGYSSHLGFKIDTHEELEQALETIRDEIHTIGDAYNRLLEHMPLPDDIRRVGGNHCIAEELIGGREIAPEGFVYQGDIHIHGLIDMPRQRGSFDRYEYPAQVPDDLSQRIEKATHQLISHIGLDNACFNVEYFYDEDRDKLWLVEVNPRISQSHSYLCEKVDGLSNHEAAVSVAVGVEPDFPRRKGRWGAAAKCMLRCWHDGVVTRTPGADELAALHERFEDCVIAPTVEEGMWLHELKEQDSYSFVIADIHVSGRDHDDLMRRYQAIVAALDIRIAEEDHDVRPA